MRSESSRLSLQNKEVIIPPAVKIELANRLGSTGMKTIEAGSFVSPKWVPQVRWLSLFSIEVH